MVHPYILHNDELKRADEPCLAAGQTGVLSGWGVFTTIRVARGVLFEFGRHFRRMQRDAQTLNVAFPDDAEAMEHALLRLVQANGRKDCTLRVAVVRNKGGLWQASGIERDWDLLALTADLHAWGREVRLALVPHGRHAASPFAGVKMLSWAENLTLAERARLRGYDETLLLNERGEVSECTSANIFVVKQGRVATPPLRSGCLPGVTREVILHELGATVAVVEEILLPADLEAADEVFITSTTRDLLPVVEVEGLQIQRRGDVRRVLEDAFGEYIDTYIASRLTLKY